MSRIYPIKFLDNKNFNNADVQFIHLLYKIGNVLGLTPIVTKRKTKSIVFKYIYTAILMTTLQVLLIYTFYRKAKRYDNFSLHRIIINGALSVSEVCFVFRSILGSVKLHPDHWKNFFNSLRKIDEIIPSDIYPIKPNRFLLLSIKVTFYHVIFLLTITYEAYTTTSSVVCFVACRTILYLEFFELIFINNICAILKTRYVALTKIVEDIFDINTRRSEETRKIALKKVFSAYQCLYKVSEEFEEIFGWQIFLILLYTVIALLNHANRILILIKETNQVENLQYKYITHGFIHPVISIVTTLVLVMSCDMVEKSSASVIITCHRQLMHLEKSPLRHDLQLITKYMEKLKPSFTAAGFFEINQMILASVFTSVTTYLIIMIQFQ